MNSSGKKSNQDKLDRLVELVGQYASIGKNETKEALSLCLEIGSPSYAALVNIMAKDIITRLDSDNSFASDNAAFVLGKVGKTSIPALSSAVRSSSYAHLALGIVARSEKDKAAKKEAINILKTELMSSDWMRVEAAVKGLGNSNNKSIVPVLKRLQSSTSNFEIMSACDEAIAKLSPLSQILYSFIKK
jgi:HEAT repeat protein